MSVCGALVIWAWRVAVWLTCAVVVLDGGKYTPDFGGVTSCEEAYEVTLRFKRIALRACKEYQVDVVW